MPSKNIPDPGFTDDDGSPDPALSRALAAWQHDPAAEESVLRALRGARLLVPVVAVLGETGTGANGLRRDKSSDMAVPTLSAPGGRRALPAFTSTASLARWQPEARPVAVPLPQALSACAQEGADTLVIDMAGPVPYELTGSALRRLASGEAGGSGDGGPVDDPDVLAALRAHLADDPDVLAAHLVPGSGETDGTLALLLSSGAEPAAVARRVAQRLAADEALRAVLVKGLDVAVMPPGSRLPARALFHR
ncbi:SseB family protein [Streptomyces sp. TR06-5]|uniref:SseB family protein n=1 Tax=unclassified Streptomyces TaxID=2593676 RepID=UPI0039A22638